MKQSQAPSHPVLMVFEDCKACYWVMRSLVVQNTSRETKHRQAFPSCKVQPGMDRDNVDTRSLGHREDVFD